MPKTKKTYHVYLLQCSDNTFYCGITTDLNRRVHEHNFSYKGARYTRGRRPATLYYCEMLPTLSSALKREYQIKKMSHNEKSHLPKTDIT